MVLYGILLEVRELEERYWPSGEWAFLLPIEARKLARTVIDHPEDPSKWRLADRRKLEEAGVKILRGIQTVKEQAAERLIQLIE